MGRVFVQAPRQAHSLDYQSCIQTLNNCRGTQAEVASFLGSPCTADMCTASDGMLGVACE